MTRLRIAPARALHLLLPALPLILTSCLGGSGASLSADTRACALAQHFPHRVRGAGVRKVWYGGQGSGRGAPKALFFTAPMHVNTDGAPNSYHPDDPAGRSRALNTICNGASVRRPDGTVVDFRQCRRLIRLYRQARGSGWTARGKPQMRFYGVAATNRSRVPCVARSGRYKGYFVSATSLKADARRPVCDQRRYLNALTVPFAIYPGHANFTGRGVGVRDLVIYYNPAARRLVFGIIGDRGPRWGLGEGSIAFGKALRGVRRDPANRREANALGLSRIHALIFPRASLRPPYTVARIRAAGRQALRAWGGRRRFLACVASRGKQP